MSALSEAIESRELAVRCPHCAWSDLRAISWLSERRDMNCPACRGVIVLNTSERRREISLLRRQVAILHKHLADLIPAADHFVNGTRRPVRTTDMALALAGVYRENLFGRRSEVRSRRGNARR